MSDFNTVSAKETVQRAIRESIEVKAELLEQHVSVVAHVAGLLTDAFRAGGKLVLFGNGGSAADAQHVAAELINRFRMDRDALAAIALTTDTSILTSVCNDSAFDQVFSRQVRALVQRGDVAVGISTSGNSPNVINGRGGGGLKDVVDICYLAPSASTPRIQEAHITVWHAICEVVEKEMFGGG